MKLQHIYKENINRNINGVIQVDQNDDKSLEQEIREYVVTRELRKHFNTFYANYEKSLYEPTNKIGVWISGFFGSGKSHFLKMLSYLLSNPVVNGKRVVEYFANKFDDPMMFAQVEACAKVPTDTLLFNVERKNATPNDRAAILHIFTKVFYEHLGFYGDDLKLARLERFIYKSGKMAEFKSKFEEINGSAWEDTRDAYSFWCDDIVETMMSVLGMSREAAFAWFNGEETAEISIEQLVKEIKEYIDSREPNYRLIFMVDEIGQFIGSDVHLMLNLQTIVEEIGAKCNGRVWVMVTSQEAVDSITKIKGDDFSKIQGRFNTRLSLSSSSVDEVIKKRILAKTQEATNALELVYNQNQAVLKNLFTFNDAILDIKGYSSSFDFVETYPFVPYQFKLIQNVFVQIRKHGNAGYSHSDGERSMLSGFQEVAQKLNDKDENAIAPFYLFYDTIHTALDSAIRRVIDRAQKAAENNEGLILYDVDVLKLLYLIRYVEDIKPNVDNIATLMVEDMRADKITIRKEVQEALDRLISQNYISRNGDRYTFLTDDEQDIERDIRNTFVDSANIVQNIAQTLFNDLYISKKFRHKGKYDFPYDQMVDDTANGSLTGAIKLRVITDAYDEKNDAKFIMRSASENEAIVVLSSDYPYFSEMESAMKIRKYVKTKTLSQLPEALQNIIRGRQQEASNHEKRAKEYLVNAINEAKFFVAGELITIKSGSAVEKLNYALGYLVESVYTKLGYITTNFNDDSDIIKVLNSPFLGAGLYANSEASEEIKQYLDLQHAKMAPTSMADIHRRFSGIPYGWRDIDIAHIVATMIVEQKVSIQYAGETILTKDRRLVDFLRKKGETEKAKISIRESIDENLLRKARGILKDYLSVMDMPLDEDGVINLAVEKLTEKRTYLQDLKNREYSVYAYPGKSIVEDGIALLDEVLLNKKDGASLLKSIVKKEDELLDSADDMLDVEAFFKNQKTIYDEARRFLDKKLPEMEYFKANQDVINSLDTIKNILSMACPYKRISELSTLMQTVRLVYDDLLTLKKEEVFAEIQTIIEDLTKLAENDRQDTLSKATAALDEKRGYANNLDTLTALDAMFAQLSALKQKYVKELMAVQVSPDKKVKTISKQNVCASASLENEQDVDAYLSEMKKKLMSMLDESDTIQII